MTKITCLSTSRSRITVPLLLLLAGGLAGVASSGGTALGDPPVLATPPAAARPAAPGSVTWSPTLAGPTTAELQQALTAPWPDPYDTSNYKTGEHRQVHNCHEALTLPKRFEPEAEIDYRAFAAERVHCHVIELLLRARPAETDHLGAFVLDDALLDKLPASLIPTPVPEEAQRFERAAAAGASWRRRDPKIKVVKRQPDEITIQSPMT